MAHMTDAVVMKNSRHMSATSAHFLNITASIEIGNDRTVPINERRANVDGVLISLKTERMDDHPHLYPEAHGEKMERRDLRRVHLSSNRNHAGQKKRVQAMKNNVPMTKEKTDADYAIAVAAQEEWNRIQGLKPVRPTSILEKRQGATKVRKLDDTIYVFIMMLVTLDKTERKFILNTT